MTRKVILKGGPVSKRATKQIIAAARRATTKKDCPYRSGVVRWSIWITAFNYKTHGSESVYKALIKAGVPCNVSEIGLSPGGTE